jgi:ribosomal protein L37AE/L43A
MQLRTSWNLLCDAVAAAGSDRMSIAMACQSWYVQNRSRLGAGAGEYGLDQLTAYDLDLYIAEDATFGADELCTARALLKPSVNRFGPEQVTRKLRDLMELAIASKNDRPCISCGHSPLHAISIDSFQLCWECPACGVCQYLAAVLHPPSGQRSRLATLIEATAMLR